MIPPIIADDAQHAADDGRHLMKAWRVHEFGTPDVMKCERVPQPLPGPGEVLVRVEAAGVGPWDAWIRAGKSALPQPLPLTLGSDLAGDIIAKGSGVVGLTLGDKIYGVTNSRFIGAYAEYALAAASMIALKPRTVTYIEAASVPVIAVTAWQALFDQARLQPGESVVIHGAAGNVGAYAVQIASRARLRVIATAAAEDLAFVRDLGAETVIDYQAHRFEDQIHGADAVIDLVGGETQERSFSVLRRGGRLISAVSQPDLDLARRNNVEAKFFLVNVARSYLAEIGKLIDDGTIRPRLGAIVPFAYARDAHLMLEGKIAHPNGKIVLAVGAN